MNQKQSADNKRQLLKFKEAARALETDESEEAFDRVLKKVAKAPAPKDDKPKKRPRTDD